MPDVQCSQKTAADFFRNGRTEDICCCPTLQDCLLEQPFCLGNRHQDPYAHRTGRFPENRYPVRISTELFNIVLNPLKCSQLIQDATIARTRKVSTSDAPSMQKSKSTQTVVESDNDNV